MLRTQAPSTLSARPRQWGAIALGVAALVAAGGVRLADATSPTGAAAYVPLSPCRLLDTRPAPFNVGDRQAPLGANESVTLVGRGDRGSCRGLRGDATGLQLNVTAVNASDATFLTLYPTGSERPNASHLNPVPDSPPVPNAVAVRLNGQGRFDVFNRFGAVDVIIDVVGVYTDHHHDDRYPTHAAVDDQIAAATTRLQELEDQATAAEARLAQVEAALAELDAPTGGEAFRPVVQTFTYNSDHSGQDSPSNVFGDLGTLHKVRDDTTLEVVWSSTGRLTGGTGVCAWSIRIDGAPAGAAANGMRPSDAMTSSPTVVPFTVVDVFDGVASGYHNVEIYIGRTGNATCVENPENLPRQIIVKEYLADESVG